MSIKVVEHAVVTKAHKAALAVAGLNLCTAGDDSLGSYPDGGDNLVVWATIKDYAVDVNDSEVEYIKKLDNDGDFATFYPNVDSLIASFQ